MFNLKNCDKWIKSSFSHMVGSHIKCDWHKPIVLYTHAQTHTYTYNLSANQSYVIPHYNKFIIIIQCQIPIRKHNIVEVGECVYVTDCMGEGKISCGVCMSQIMWVVHVTDHVKCACHRSCGVCMSQIMWTVHVTDHVDCACNRSCGLWCM